jgi:hypothetical protein
VRLRRDETNILKLLIEGAIVRRVEVAVLMFCSDSSGGSCKVNPSSRRLVLADGSTCASYLFLSFFSMLDLPRPSCLGVAIEKTRYVVKLLKQAEFRQSHC